MLKDVLIIRPEIEKIVNFVDHVVGKYGVFEEMLNGN